MSFSGSERLCALIKHGTQFDKNMSKCNITTVKSPKLSFPEGVQRTVPLLCVLKMPLFQLRGQSPQICPFLREMCLFTAILSVVMPDFVIFYCFFIPNHQLQKRFFLRSLKEIRNTKNCNCTIMYLVTIHYKNS